MIAKVTKGRSFEGLLRYLYGPGHAEEHQDAHAIAANVLGDDPRTLADELAAVTAHNARLSRPVWHASLRLPEGESLDDEAWSEAAITFLERLQFLEEGSGGQGPTDAPYVVVRHGEDHVHVVASRVRFDGRTVSDSWDYIRSHRAVRAVERAHGLSSPDPAASTDLLAAVSKSERERAVRRNCAPERLRLRAALEEARDYCDGTLEDFERRARAAGARLRANVASTGRISGYSATLTGWRDRGGGEVWLAASKVHRSLRWSQLDRDLAARRELTRAL